MILARSPARRLFDLLCELDSPGNLETNINEDTDYGEMRGPLESRFCEWVYFQRERQQLATRLLQGVIRVSEVDRLAELAGVPAKELKGLDPRLRLGAVLDSMQLPEPKPPPHIESGLAEIGRFHGSLYGEYDEDSRDIEGRNVSPEGLTPSARRGCERLLKLLVTFLWDSGYRETITDVAEGRLHGFGRNVRVTENVEWFRAFTGGALNHLLRAVDRERQRRGIPLLFKRGADAFWPDEVFHSVEALVNALNKEVHEGLAVEERRQIQKKATEEFRKVVEKGLLRIPQSVQFFRRFTDGHVSHYEGLTYGSVGWKKPRGAVKSERITFYEAPQELDLHRPYMFLAATNPSAIDVACAPLSQDFREPV